MNKLDIYEIAQENNLQVIETTTGMNGYPQNLRNAIIGFDNFDEAKTLATKYGLRITTFFKKDGWQLWNRTGNITYRPMHITSSDYGDDYTHYSCSDAILFYENEVQPFLENFDNLDDLTKFIQEKQELLDEIKSIDDCQIIIACCGRCYDIIDRELMEWSYNTKNYVIGVISD